MLHSCPNCGYCPHCGRGGYVRPYVRPAPIPPWYWQRPPLFPRPDVTLTLGRDMGAHAAAVAREAIAR